MQAEQAEPAVEEKKEERAKFEVLPDEPEIQKPSGFQTSTVRELGQSLPIGLVNVKGELRKEFVLGKKLDFQVERAIGEYKVKIDEANESYMKVLVKVVALLLTNLGGEPFDHSPDDKPEDAQKKLLQVSTLYMPDVWYMYLYARIQAYGADLITSFSHTCGFSANRVKYDLKQMDVVHCDNMNDLRQPVDLVYGLKYRDGTVKKRVYVFPLHHFDMESKDAREMGEEAILMRLHMVSKCVREVEGFDQSIVLTPDEYQSLHGVDIQRIMDVINTTSCGPRMAMEIDCPGKGCGETILYGVNYRYENFFAKSSRS